MTHKAFCALIFDKSSHFPPHQYPCSRIPIVFSFPSLLAVLSSLKGRVPLDPETFSVVSKNHFVWMFLIGPSSLFSHDVKSFLITQKDVPPFPLSFFS